jgi:hypothetical protein
LCDFCGQKDSMRRIFIKKYFLLRAESVCRVNMFTTGSRNYLNDVQKSQMPDQAESELRNWLRQQSKLLCCGFRHSTKVMEQVYQHWWRICREINVIFQVRISCFTFYIHL